MQSKILSISIAFTVLISSQAFSSPYFQEVSQRWAVENGIPFAPIDIAIHEQKLWLLGDGEVAKQQAEEFQSYKIDEPGAKCIVSTRNGLLVGGSRGIWRLDGDHWQLQKSPAPVERISEDSDGRIWVVANDTLYFWQGQQWQVYRSIGAKVRDMVIWRKTEGALATDLGVWLLKGKRHYFMELLPRPGGLLSLDTKAVARGQRGTLFIGTNEGLSIYDLRNTWLSLTPEKGLPIKNITCVVPGEDGTLWLGSDRGVARLLNGRWQYFASRRWLVDDVVRKIVVQPMPDTSPRQTIAYVLTKTGVACLYRQRMSLREKADLYSQRVEERHKRFGYVMNRRLDDPGVVDSGKVAISDNDGLWTGLSIAAQSFRYGALQKIPGMEKEAQQVLEQVEDSLDALFFLQKVTGIPGFPARAVRHKSEPEYGIPHPEWHRSKDGEWEWKGDTSSDEIAGHYFAFFAAYQHFPAYRDKIRAATKAMTDHLLENDLTIVDTDGLPTTWGIWNPKNLNMRDMWLWERGLGSLEILSHLKVAHHIVGDERYIRVYNDLAERHHYAINTIEQKIVEPYQVYHDNQLAYCSYYPLLLLEDDAALRRMYLMSLANTFRYVKNERSPLWNFITALFLEGPCGVAEGIQTLREIPLDLVDWRIDNSHRKDIRRRPKDKWNDEDLATEPLPYTQRPLRYWDGNPYRLDGGGNGRNEHDPTIFLLPYWLGKYHGLISNEE